MDPESKDFLGSSENGFLIVDTRGTIHWLDVSKQHLDKVAELPNISDFQARNISLAGRKLIYEKQLVGVFSYDLASEEEKLLVEGGRCPRALPKKQILLYTKTESIDSGFIDTIYVTSIEDVSESVRLAHSAHGSAAYCPIVLTDETALVYMWGDSGDLSLSIYDSRSNSLENLKGGDTCVPVVGMGDRRIVCEDGDVFQITAGELIQLDDYQLSGLGLPIAYSPPESSMLVQEFLEHPFSVNEHNLLLVGVVGGNTQFRLKDVRVAQRGALFVRRMEY